MAIQKDRVMCNQNERKRLYDTMTDCTINKRSSIRSNPII